MFRGVCFADVTIATEAGATVLSASFPLTVSARQIMASNTPDLEVSEAEVNSVILVGRSSFNGLTCARAASAPL